MVDDADEVDEVDEVHEVEPPNDISTQLEQPVIAEAMHRLGMSMDADIATDATLSMETGKFSAKGMGVVLELMKRASYEAMRIGHTAEEVRLKWAQTYADGKPHAQITQAQADAAERLSDQRSRGVVEDSLIIFYIFQLTDDRSTTVGWKTTLHALLLSGFTWTGPLERAGCISLYDDLRTSPRGGVDSGGVANVTSLADSVEDMSLGAKDCTRHHANESYAEVA